MRTLAGSASGTECEREGEGLDVVLFSLAKHAKVHVGVFFASHTPRFAPTFVEALDKGTPAALRALLTEECGSDVVSFDMFTKEYCDLLMEELKVCVQWCGSG